MNTKTNHFTDRPLAAPGLTSYRCKIPFGWVMIGAKDDDEALREARRSRPTASAEDLQVWDGSQYIACVDAPTGSDSENTPVRERSAA